MKNVYQKYQNQAVQTASREKILLLLYEAAIKFTKKAISAVEAKDIAGRGENIGRAYDIVMELNNTLDHKVGGEIAKNLEQLYMFMTERLTQGNIKNDAKPLQEALKIMEILYSGWVEAIQKLKKEDAGA